MIVSLFPLSRIITNFAFFSFVLIYFTADLPKYENFSFGTSDFDKTNDSDESEKNNSDLDFLSDHEQATNDVEMDLGSSD